MKNESIWSFPSNVDKTLEYFAKFDRTREFASSSDGPRLTWTRTRSTYSGRSITPSGLQWKNWLSVAVERDTQDRVFQVYGCVLLRQHTREKHLIVGCGNRPVFSGRYCMMETMLGMEYTQKHTHHGFYTINPDIGMNPSVVMEFGQQEYMFLPEAAFKKVLFEKFFWESEPKFWKESLLHVLQEGGCASVRGDQRERVFAVKNHGELISPTNCMPITSFQTLLALTTLGIP